MVGPLRVEVTQDLTVEQRLIQEEKARSCSYGPLGKRSVRFLWWQEVHRKDTKTGGVKSRKMRANLTALKYKSGQIFIELTDTEIGNRGLVTQTQTSNSGLKEF
ncbi:hypothetical protein PoB_006522800 [Plakobranchus ocellatus]|uniref:Uncharacterized protein n=1 Tax=Plakobranchus ocellatus TaxID=259542 RepID=A0AAV4D3X0_9GAST|nr:hypothetical protein PoB_006522800 [Plakobranchus ocellatus]